MPTEAAEYFAVEPLTGDIRIDPMLADYTEGVFTLDIIATQQRAVSETAQLTHIVKQVACLSKLANKGWYRRF
ncbi:unnamed protein product [Gongylonema pulchrum]|uniref:Aconitate hydratase n=1 Tax=Gongylonema pulchrum TaxID=637853 RepID=A0A183D6G2_9BILA|nr:unnamed protein product [Gongylonema pulchrum]